MASASADRSLVLSQLLPAFDQRPLAFGLLLVEAPHFAIAGGQAVVRSRQTELDGHRLAAARLTIGVEMVNAARIFQQSCFGQCEL